MGFAQTYAWTKDVVFLETSIKCAEYFLSRCKEGEGKWEAPRVPRWDFDAPIGEEEGDQGVLRDASAGVIAANGFLIIHQALQGLSASVAGGIASETKFLDEALEIVAQTLRFCYDSDLAAFLTPKGTVNGDVGHYGVQVRESGFDGILRHSTTNWNEHAHMKYKDHGLVYADYYLLEFGNKLLRAGLL
jgi:hypothetical protein